MTKLYLGRLVDPQTMEVTNDPLMIDANDLTTHAVILGMTGSGKTGAAIVLLEEALLNGIPVIVIDPKGDATNIAIRVKRYVGEEIEPWISHAEAKKSGKELSEYAEELAQKWVSGLKNWGLDPSLAEKLAEIPFDVYTPGSKAGIPISVVGDLNKPEGLSITANEEILRERVDALTSALLHLVGIETKSVSSKPHVYLSQILLWAWENDVQLDFETLINYVLHPPFDKVGALPVETYMPKRDRTKLAVALNGVIASPYFKFWVEGVPLDIERMLWSEDGRPRAAIFYLAHLDDRWRMFAVTLILEAVYTWMFRKGSSGGLRCIIYFDEVYGYLPPHPRNPPSKRPIMLLLKQGRAFGVGVVLSTQNPVDVDYKALSNAGIWIIGRLQTERDRDKVLQGLEMASTEAGRALPVKEVERLITSLKRRVFLIHNVHAGAPRLFMTRWALTVLRGPLTLNEISKLPRSKQALEYLERKRIIAKELFTLVPPETKEIEQFFLPVRVKVEGLKAYFPLFLVSVSVDMRRRRPQVEYQASARYLVLPVGAGGSIEVTKEALGVLASEISPEHLQTRRDPNLRFRTMPKYCFTKTLRRRLETATKSAAISDFTIIVYYVPGTDVVSRPGESFEDFLARTKHLIEKLWSSKVEKELAPYRRKVESLSTKLRQLELEIRQLSAEKDKLKVLVALKPGDKRLRRKRERVESKLARLRVQLEVLREEYRKAVEELEKAKEALPSKEQMVRSAVLRPRKHEVSVESISLVWVPVLLNEETLVPSLNLYTGRPVSAT